LKKKEQLKARLSPSEFKLFDNRIDYQVEHINEFDSPKVGEDTKIEEENEIEEIEITEGIKPDQFKIGDDRLEFEVGETDGFSQTEINDGKFFTDFSLN
jgi:hypothetical protein